ncbi:hypothetical protein T265_08907 [Opisthorchis viverrini]|uniref:Uncharacterized protein n=1 Tax=Opisthorchis viverrini TaxID=6198 RepID=A0A074Z7H1_OPIVI|nr:hypothetical protein T265_08907 [Opisthorchis viverrini]KER23136.1 hypothetical protein T265_08907 [Opisthorchis viverrini]
MRRESVTATPPTHANVFTLQRFDWCARLIERRPSNCFGCDDLLTRQLGLPSQSEPPVLGTKSDRKKHLRDQETWWIQRAEEREESKNDENVDQLATSRHTGGPGPLSDCCFVRQSNYYAWCAGWSSAVIQPDSRPIAHPRTVILESPTSPKIGKRLLSLKGHRLSVLMNLHPLCLKQELELSVAVATFRCLTAIPPDGVMRAEILPSCSNLDRSGQDVVVLFEPRQVRALTT